MDFCLNFCYNDLNLHLLFRCKMTLKGPYLRLQDNQPVSWVVIDVTDGQAPQLYEKDLENGATYQPFQINENETIHAIIPTSQQKLMWTRLNDVYYEVQNSTHRYLVVNFQNISLPLKRASIPKEFPQPKFSEIDYAANDTEKEYYKTAELEKELASVSMSQLVIPEPPARKDYSLNALIQGIELTTTQWAVLEKLETLWFFDTIDEQHIPYACQLILSQVSVDVCIEQILDTKPTTLRQNFCWPKNIAENFERDVLISDVIDFTYLLVNEVYKLHTSGQELDKPDLPISAYQTVGQFLNLPEENPVRALNQGPNIFQSSNYDALIIAVRSELYPSIQLSLIAKWCEWIVNVCRILDIYCLRMSNIGKEVSKHQAMPEDKKDEYNQKFFSSQGNFDDNIRNLYVSQLWKGR